MQATVTNWMNAQSEHLFSRFFLFAVIILIPWLILRLRNGSKLLQIYVTHPGKFVFFAIGQWLLFIVEATYASFKTIRNARTP